MAGTSDLRPYSIENPPEKIDEIMSTGKIAAVVVGVIVALVGIGLLVGGGLLLWANGTQRGDDGFFTTGEVELSTDSHAIVSEEIDLGSRPSDWFPSGRLATVRIAATGDQPIFIGIGPESDVDDYLDGVAISQLVRIGIDGDNVVYRDIEGEGTPAAPGDQDFWAVSAEGADTQSVEWDLDKGRWAAVIMNADGSADITVDASAGADTDLLIPVAIGFLVGGLILGVVAAVVIGAALASSRGEPVPAASTPGGYGRYPVLVEGEIDPGLSRWQWLFKWLLAIPHFVVLAFLWVAFFFVSVIAFFAILFTARYPRSLFDFNVGVLRWSWRVGYYTYSVGATDQYPPFSLADTDYPARFDVAYPERLSRGLVLVKWWLLAIPHFLIVGLFTSGLVWYTTEIGESGNQVVRSGAGLIGILVFIALVILLFTGRYTQGLFDLIMGLNRWVFRVAAYVGLMRDEYPPFRLDSGGSEPGGDDAAPLDAGSGAAGEIDRGDPAV